MLCVSESCAYYEKQCEDNRCVDPANNERCGKYGNDASEFQYGGICNTLCYGCMYVRLTVCVLVCTYV